MIKGKPPAKNLGGIAMRPGVFGGKNFDYLKGFRGKGLASGWRRSPPSMLRFKAKIRERRVKGSEVETGLK